MDNRKKIRDMAESASFAHRQMLGLTSRKKRDILYSIADELESCRDEILSANKKDVAESKSRGRSEAFLDRLSITELRFSNLVRAFRVIADSKDPIGEQISRWIRPNGLEIVRRRVPIGVVGIALESRPHVVALAAAICFKVNNAVVVVGDSESSRTCKCLSKVIRNGGERSGLPADALQVLCSEDNLIDGRILTSLEGLVDLAILRGDLAFVTDLTAHARIPVLKHTGGLCHIYIDCDRIKPPAGDPPPVSAAAPGFSTAKAALEVPSPEAGALPAGDQKVNPVDLDSAVEIVINSRCLDPYSCNSANVVLVHKNIASRFLPTLALRAEAEHVELHGDERAVALLPGMQLADADEWHNPRKEVAITIGIVDSLEDAIEHINNLGSHLSDTIISPDIGAQNVFMRDVDSAAVYSNASTNFTDGGEFGMGAEIGLSNDKLFARGPIGLEDLTSTKYIVRGSGQTKV